VSQKEVPHFKRLFYKNCKRYKENSLQQKKGYIKYFCHHVLKMISPRWRPSLALHSSRRFLNARMTRSVTAGGIAAISRRIASLRAWRFRPLIWDGPTRRNHRERDLANALATRHRRAGRSASPETFPANLAWIPAPCEPLLHAAETRHPPHPFLPVGAAKSSLTFQCNGLKWR